MFKNLKKSNLIINGVLTVFLMFAVISCGSDESADSDLNPEIIERVGEQKISLETLISLVEK